jgi:hypothetical protein
MVNNQPVETTKEEDGEGGEAIVVGLVVRVVRVGRVGRHMTQAMMTTMTTTVVVEVGTLVAVKIIMVDAKLMATLLPEAHHPGL